MEDGGRTGNRELTTGNSFSTGNHGKDAKRTRPEAIDCGPQAFEPNHVTPGSDRGHES
jgi:hypothetical protein